MNKAKVVRDLDGLFYGIKFLCPGCLWDDGLPPGETQESPDVTGKPHWSFNGDFERPVLNPSVLT